jgi:SAM-dependent methyltransferase
VGVTDAPGAAWQQPGLVDEFLAQRQRVLPLLDVQEALIRRVLERHGRPLRRFLDVGCGAGAMTELALAVAPGAEAVLVDYSEPMLAAAEARLAGTAAPGSLRIVRADLRDAAWHGELLDGSFDAVISGLAIHHLDSARKRELFAEVFGLLAPGGMFLNMDVVVVDGPLHGLFDEEMAALAIAHEHEQGGGRSDEEVERELLCDDSDDRPDRADSQLEWLRAAGFTDVELHFKWAEAAVFGATRPS